VPARQLLHDWAAVGENWPAGQAVHVACPVLDWKVPAEQLVQYAAPDPAYLPRAQKVPAPAPAGQKLPAGQARQAVPGAPAAVKYWPAPHEAQPVDPELFWNWPLGQLGQLAAAAALYWPAGHVAQSPEAMAAVVDR
jgi:hypothetical protein